MTAASPAVQATHTGHLLLAGAFVLVSLVGVGLVETYQRRRREGTAPPALAVVVAAAGTASAGVHAAVLAAHWRESVLLGLFFLVAALAQLAGSLVLVLRPTRPAIQVNALANVAILLVWLQSRTVGVAVGPAAGRPEPLGMLDVTSSLLEVGVVLGTVGLLGRWVRATPRTA